MKSYGDELYIIIDGKGIREAEILRSNIDHDVLNRFKSAFEDD